ncbi:MAG: methylmalonyl-CoA mutase family protein [Acidobacteriota bacterium]
MAEHTTDSGSETDSAPDSSEHDFPPVSYDDWRRRVEEELGGKPFARLRSEAAGIEIEPLYGHDNAGQAVVAAGWPGLPPYVRGARPLGSEVRAWRVARHYDVADAEQAARRVRDDIDMGVELVWLRLDDAARAGHDPDGDPAAVGRNGIPVDTADDVSRLLAAIDPAATSLVLDAGSNALAAAALLLATENRRRLALEDLRGSFGCDPLAALARDGRLPGSLDQAFRQMAALTTWASSLAPQMRAVTVSTVPHHEAGASAVTELAIAMATTTEYLRRLTASGIDVETAASQILFAFAIGRDFFVEIAKLRAARWLWAKVMHAAGADERVQAMRIHAVTSHRGRTARDPWVNMLRDTTEAFAAVVGGARSVATTAFDRTLGTPADWSRRVSVNVQHLLAEESHLGRVVDPVGGSFYVEKLTEDLARAAWRRFQDIEAAGGMSVYLTEGGLERTLATRAAARQRDVAFRRDALVGVSLFPRLDEEIPERETVTADLAARSTAVRRHRERHDARAVLASLAGYTDSGMVEVAVEAAEQGATIGQLSDVLWSGTDAATAPKLEPLRLAAAFEALRSRADDNPRVFLAAVGARAKLTARMSFVVDLLAAGGLHAVYDEALYPDGEAAVKAFAAAETPLVVVVATDDRYDAILADVVPALREVGARRVLVAGRMAAVPVGVDETIHLGCDVIAALTALLDVWEATR